MKKNEILSYVMLALWAVLPLSCIQDEEFNSQEVSAGNGLKIGLETSGILTKVSEDGLDVLNENTVQSAVLLIFNAEGNRTQGGYIPLDLSDGITEVLVASGNWKNDSKLFDKGSRSSYDLYVVANAHGTSAFQNVTTVSALQAAVDEDTDIWKMEKANIGSTQYTGKKFAMTGMSEGFVPANVDDDYTLPIDMQRLAAKVEVQISFDESFKAKYTPTGFYSSLRNYATKGLWLADGETSFNDWGLAGNGADEPMAAAYAHDFTACTATLILYSYPNNWSNDVLSETFVLLNMPGTYKNEENPGDPDNGGKESNYYKIPIRLGGADAHKINRNTIYKVKVTIDRLGQLKPDIPVELTPEYEVYPWEEVYIDVGSDDVEYLELREEEIIMKDITTSSEQYFTSSSPIESVTIDKVYYYDKYGNRQTILSNQYNQYGISASAEGGLSGSVTVNSDVPTNNGIRYIKVIVMNKQGDSKSFTVKQYPLEYIVTVPGWYSYRDDFGSTYETLNGNNRKMWNDLFASKVYTNGSIYEYAWYNYSWYSGWNTGSRPSDVQLGSQQTTNPNNNMYFVRITKTSDQYVLSVPAMDVNGYTESSSENNQLVAPAFMIASQLGTVTIQSFDNAKTHCNQYAEKSLDGEVYDDWRLPTEAELLIIDKYQGNDNSVIDRVLAGDYYWAASGRVLSTNEEEDWRGNVIWNMGEIIEAPSRSYYGKQHYIRCVRTVKSTEPIVEDKE